jgi:hypothetical protein
LAIDGADRFPLTPATKDDMTQPNRKPYIAPTVTRHGGVRELTMNVGNTTLNGDPGSSDMGNNKTA